MWYNLGEIKILKYKFYYLCVNLTCNCQKLKVFLNSVLKIEKNKNF